MSFRKNFDPSVYFVADPDSCAGRPVADVVREAAAGGVTMVQLRNKSGDALSFFEQAKEIADILKPLGIPFIINDRVDICFAVNADGVHLGQDDLSATEARQLLGPDKIIGVTAFKRGHFARIKSDVVDYAGTGPFYPTFTKPGKDVLGAEKFSELVQISKVPVIGIGGITPENAGAVMEVGAAGVAMMRGISEAPDPKKAAEEFVNIIKGNTDDTQHLKHSRI
jgi:thiamine-phosphate pyrophosphorylase